MPTGTGKTDTMLALLCAAQLTRVLVIVPSDVLRTQTAGKFETLGVLQSVGVLSNEILRPSVGQIKHRFSNADSARKFTESCNVIIATPPALYASKPEIRRVIFAGCSHLFVDEAHHIAASTWREIRDDFSGKPVVQFTATPFREDGRHLGGRLIYSYPLREAQLSGYFSPINFISVLDLADHDRAVAAKAVERLRTDIESGLDHLLMARVARIGRADDILPIYQELAPDLSPVVLHTGDSASARAAAVAAIRSRASRIVICVNMLGEGFDLPSLKIAAIHDAHKSLGVTLQFIGRFARTADLSLGAATVVVGRPSGIVDPSLRRLYAEDSDWNLVIRDLSEGTVTEQAEVSEFEAAFGSLPEEVALRSLLPKMSTVVYRTRIEAWNPHAVQEIYPEEQLLTAPIAINERDHVAWFVTENRTPVKWGQLRTIEEVTYDLYVLYWDAQRQLLYINSSNNDSLHEALAKAVCGQSATRISGENVYRVMARVERLVPTNVGLLDVRNRSRRFSMHVGADVIEGFPVAESQTKTKTNIFAYGYEEGHRVSVGGSLKGRVWSYRVAQSLKHWTDWCDHVGSKLTDESLSVDDIMRHFIRPKSLEQRPTLVPLALEWPWQVYAGVGEELVARRGGLDYPLVDIDFEVTSQQTSGDITFHVRAPGWAVSYQLRFQDGGMRFSTSEADATVVSRARSFPLSDLLNELGLYIHFEHDAIVVPPAMLLKPDRELATFDKDKLQALDWQGIDLTVESQGAEQRQDSIQARMISHLLSLSDWDVVVDDDGPGEIADIVGLSASEDTLTVHLVHCKYVSGGNPRAQVEDLYEVCGQAQKSARWRRDSSLMIQRLIGRERRRLDRGRRSGLIKGDASMLYRLEERARLLKSEFTISIAQPGLSKERVSRAQLELLASTETYLYETAHAQVKVYCSR